jgi:hypothetical protein
VGKRAVLVVLTDSFVDKALTVFSFVAGGVIELLNFIVRKRTIGIVAVISRALNMRVTNLTRISPTITLVMVKPTTCQLVDIGRLLTIGTQFSFEGVKLKTKELVSHQHLHLLIMKVRTY